jgi:hypothetical protein
MKLQNSLLVTLIFLGSAISAQQLTQQFTFSQGDDLQVTQSGEYDIIRITDGYQLQGEEHAGEPQLPIKQFKLLLPQGASATGVTISINSEQQLSGSFYIYPVQLPVYSNKGDPPPFVDPDPAIYNSNDPFPGDYILKYFTSGFRDYNYVTVSFMPFRYIPLSRQLHLLTDVTITINYTVHSTDQVYKLRPYGSVDDMAYEFIQNIVINSAQTDVYNPYAANQIAQFRSSLGTSVSIGGFEPAELPALEGSEVHYVIITNNTDIYGNPVGNFSGKFQNFANWKTQSGSPAKVITVDVIRDNYPGVDIAEQIREFIKDAHKLWNTEYVLLGGNTSIVPVRLIGIMPTDLYYSAIWHPVLKYNDNWNSNGDDQFGDASSDFTPDIAVGRAPVDTDDEVDLFINKNFTYNRCSFAPSIPDGEWLNKQLNIGGIVHPNSWSVGNDLGLYRTWQITEYFSQLEGENSSPNNNEQYTMHEYLNGWDNSHPDWSPAYFPTDSNANNPSGIPINDEYMEHLAVIEQLNQRYGIVNHLEHGWIHGLYLKGASSDWTSLGGQEFQDLSATEKYSVLVTVGCHTCPIELDNYVGEQWITAPNGGVSFIGTSLDIISWKANEYDYQFFSSLYNDNIFNLVSYL